MCGLIAVLLADPDARACQLLYDGLTMLQHRGQIENPLFFKENTRMFYGDAKASLDKLLPMIE